MDVDRNVIKMGSELRIAGFPNTTFRAEDIGGAIKGKHIDLWFPNHKEALNFLAYKRSRFIHLENLFLLILLLSDATLISG